MGREGKVRKDGAGGGEKVGKGEGGLDLDICPGAVEFLVSHWSSIIAALSKPLSTNSEHLLAGNSPMTPSPRYCSGCYDDGHYGNELSARHPHPCCFFK